MSTLTTAANIEAGDVIVASGGRLTVKRVTRGEHTVTITFEPQHGVAGVRSMHRFSDPMTVISEDDDREKTEPATPATLAPFAAIRVGSGRHVHATRSIVNGGPSVNAKSLCRITSGRVVLNVMPARAGEPIDCPKCLAVLGASASIVSAVTA